MAPESYFWFQWNCKRREARNSISNSEIHFPNDSVDSDCYEKQEDRLFGQVAQVPLDNKFKVKKKDFWTLRELGTELTTPKQTFVFVEPVWCVFLKPFLSTSIQVLFVPAMATVFWNNTCNRTLYVNYCRQQLFYDQEN